MTAESEWRPEQGEGPELTIESIREQLWQHAESQSLSFALGKKLEIEPKYSWVTDEGTSCVVEFRATRVQDDQGHDAGVSYYLGLDVQQTVMGLPSELIERIMMNGDTPPSVDDIEQVDAGYGLSIYFYNTGEVNWSESRTYGLWTKSGLNAMEVEEEIDMDSVVSALADDAEEAADDEYPDELDEPAGEYRIRLGHYFSGSPEKENEGTPTDDKEFQAIIGGISLQAVYKEEYLKKALDVLAYHQLGNEAEVDIAHYLDQQVVEEIRM